MSGGGGSYVTEMSSYEMGAIAAQMGWNSSRLAWLFVQLRKN
jgi:hypothetical protein